MTTSRTACLQTSNPNASSSRRLLNPLLHLAMVTGKYWRPPPLKPDLLGPCRVRPGRILVDYTKFYTPLNLLWAFRIAVIPGEMRPRPTK